MVNATKISVKNPGKEQSRTGLSIEALKQGFRDQLFYSQGRPLEIATTNDMDQNVLKRINGA